jgi:hypothetical protein
MVRLRCRTGVMAPAWRAVRQTSRRTSPGAPVAQETTWNGTGAQDCPRRAGGGGPGDPVRAVGGQVGQQPGPFLAELAGEGVHGPGLAAGRGPDQQPGVVVHHDDQVLMAAFIGDLVDPDAAQPRRAGRWPPRPRRRPGR